MSIEDKFPPHKAGFFLSHNEHKNYYETVQEWYDRFAEPIGDWISYKQKKKAYETNNCWHIQWFPNTPIGSRSLLAADLEPLLEAACQP